MLAIFAMLASGLTGYYTYDSNRRLLVARTERNLQSYAQALGQRLVSSLNSVARDARLLAVQGNGEGGSQEDVLRTARALMQTHPEYLYISLVDVRQDWQNWQEPVRIVRDENTQLRQVTNADDPLLAYLKPALLLAPGQIFLSEVIAEKNLADGERHHSAFLVAAPFMRANGMNSSIMITICISLESLFKEIRTELPLALQLYLADDQGRLIHHASREQTQASDGRSLQDLFPAVTPIIDGSQNVLMLNESAQNPSGKLMAFVRVQSADFSDRRFFILGLSEPLDVVFQENQTLSGHIWRIVLSFSLVALLLAWLVSQAITRPLGRILTSVRRFATGDSSGEILLPTRREDEIGLLAQGVEEMQNQIRAQLEALEENHQAMQHMAHHDALTGLPNRPIFFTLLENAIALARRQRRRFAILFIDLDRFKEVNDTYGHHVGDLLLLAVARHLQNSVRESDTVARLAGDEFITMLNPVHNAEEARLVGQKLLQHFNEPLELEGVTLSIHASIGISLYP
ncbi:MAG: GGDEF domain-containing protein, partial [Zoogloeaceae bacterium]|nr:GGDEF domain-containing protein [Zoogloeaceae bacterium]